MTKNPTKWAAISLIGLAATSCASEDEPINESRPPVEDNSPFTIIATYKGKTYEVPCIMENDSVVYLDDEFSKLYNDEISKHPNLAMFANKDEQGRDVVAYFENENTLANNLNVKAVYLSATGNSRANITHVGTAWLFDDVGYEDRNVKLDLYSNAGITIFSLKEYQAFNDKTSSIRLENFMETGTYYYIGNEIHGGYTKSGGNLRVCLTSYEDSNFKGKVLYCVGEYWRVPLSAGPNMPHSDYNLKKLGWNDKISSCVFQVITVDDITNGVVNPHPYVK